MKISYQLARMTIDQVPKSLVNNVYNTGVFARSAFMSSYAENLSGNTV